MLNENNTILGIESSCDDTSAAVLKGRKLLSNVTANQSIHEAYGGVVPELASRAHQQNIVPVVDQALKQAGINKEELDAIAFTRGPGLLGSLLVGTSFAKSFALALDIPLIEVNHMQGHILAHFIEDEDFVTAPAFPFLCLTVSGGHTQIVRMDGIDQHRVIGETIDDAAGEAFDKAAKILGFPYPGGPLIDKFAREGNPEAFEFPTPNIPGLNFSFSGLKTAFLYCVRDGLEKDPDFIEKNKADLCASIQAAIIRSLLGKLKRAAREENIQEIALAGGVSANSGLRTSLQELAAKMRWKTHVPKLAYCTDNAAMIAMSGHFKFLKEEFASQSITPLARFAL